MKKRMIVIGANGSATKRTIPALSTSEICEIVALQSRNQQKLQSTCQQYSIANYYSSIDDILEKEEYDFVYIANPPFMHLETIQACLKQQKPLLCEKPLARNFKEAQAIAELLKDYKPAVRIAHHLRHQQAYRDLKELLTNQRIGQVSSVWGQWGFNINHDAASSTWKLSKDLGGGGTLSDNGIHVLDFLLSLFGVPKEVGGNCHLSGFKETFANETLLLSYADKDLLINSSHNMPHPGNHLLIYGNKGKIEIPACFSEKSIKQINLFGNQDEVLVYQEENLYKNEVEDFINCHLLKNAANDDACTVEQQLLALEIIDELRKNIAI